MMMPMMCSAPLHARQAARAGSSCQVEDLAGSDGGPGPGMGRRRGPPRDPGADRALGREGPDKEETPHGPCPAGRG
jgi:hypothetical protein